MNTNYVLPFLGGGENQTVQKNYLLKNRDSVLQLTQRELSLTEEAFRMKIPVYFILPREIRCRRDALDYRNEVNIQLEWMSQEEKKEGMEEKEDLTLGEQLPLHRLLQMELLRATGIKPRQKDVLRVRSLSRALSRTMSSSADGVGSCN